MLSAHWAYLCASTVSYSLAAVDQFDGYALHANAHSLHEALAKHHDVSDSPAQSCHHHDCTILYRIV